MPNEIKNRVAESKLVVFDLEDYYPNEKIIDIYLAQWLEGGFVLRETDFRNQLNLFSWENYTDTLCFLHCSTDAVVPAWAFMLVAKHLQAFATLVVQGTKKELLIQYYVEKLTTLDYTFYQDKPLIIKGCSSKPVPPEMYVYVQQKLQPFAQSIMYGEACSAVPLYKRGK